MIFILATFAVVLTAFVVCEVVLRPHVEQLTHSRMRKVQFVHERLVRIRNGLSILSKKELERFDNDLRGFVDAYEAIVSVYTQTAANFRTPATAFGLWWSNRTLRFTLHSLRRVEVEILARTQHIDRRILTWAEYQLQLVLGELESTRRWVKLFLPKHEHERWYDMLARASDGLTSAHEHLKYDAQRVAHPELLVRMREALAAARASITDVQQRVQEITDDALGKRAEHRLS